MHKDWALAIKTGKPPGSHFGYAGPFTEAYRLGNIALRIGHRIGWDPLAFRITNCREECAPCRLPKLSCCQFVP